MQEQWHPAVARPAAEGGGGGGGCRSVRAAKHGLRSSMMAPITSGLWLIRRLSP